jgi:hypothetical protein
MIREPRDRGAGRDRNEEETFGHTFSFETRSLAASGTDDQLVVSSLVVFDAATLPQRLATSTRMAK